MADVLGSSPAADSNIMSIFQRKHHEILAGIGVGCEEVALGVRITIYRALNCIHRNLQVIQRHRAVRFPCDSTAFLFCFDWRPQAIDYEMAV